MRRYSLPMRDERGRFLAFHCVEMEFNLVKALEEVYKLRLNGNRFRKRVRVPEGLKQLGFREISNGYYKTAFLHKNWVLKVDKRRDLSIPRELRVLSEAKKHGKLHLLAETYYVGGCVIQPRYDTNEDKYEDRYAEIQNVAYELNIRDVHEGNVGWDGDRFVFIDFDSTNWD